MTAPLEPTVAHGGTRLGETVPITVTELRHCDELRAMETRLLALVDRAEVAGMWVSPGVLRDAIAGAK